MLMPSQALIMDGCSGKSKQEDFLNRQKKRVVPRGRIELPTP